MSENGHVSPFKLGILASHAGTNFQAILERCLTGEIPAQIGIVISNNSDSGALKRAEKAGIKTAHFSSVTHPNVSRLDEAITHALVSEDINLVVLAGYMRKLGPTLLGQFSGRVVNIHPSLLPAFGGQGMYGERVHRAVLEAGCRVSGVTIHVVDGEYDHGPIIAQEPVPVLHGDSPKSLAQRVLNMEHRLYSSVIREIALGKIRIEGGCVIYDV